MVGLPRASIKEAIALAIDLVVHIGRDLDRRQITEVMALQGYDVAQDRFKVAHLYTHGSVRR